MSTNAAAPIANKPQRNPCSRSFGTKNDAISIVPNTIAPPSPPKMIHACAVSLDEVTATSWIAPSTSPTSTSASRCRFQPNTTSPISNAVTSSQTKPRVSGIIVRHRVGIAPNPHHHAVTA